MLETTGKRKRHCDQQEALPLQPPVYVHLGSTAAPTSTPVRAQRSRPRSQQSAAQRCKLCLWQTAPLQGRGVTAHSQSVVRSLRFTPVAAKQQEHYDLNMLGQVCRALVQRAQMCARMALDSGFSCLPFL